MSQLTPGQERIAKRLRDLDIPVNDETISAFSEGAVYGANQVRLAATQAHTDQIREAVQVIEMESYEASSVPKVGA